MKTTSVEAMPFGLRFSTLCRETRATKVFLVYVKNNAFSFHLLPSLLTFLFSHYSPIFSSLFPALFLILFFLLLDFSLSTFIVFLTFPDIYAICCVRMQRKLLRLKRETIKFETFPFLGYCYVDLFI